MPKPITLIDSRHPNDAYYGVPIYATWNTVLLHLASKVCFLTFHRIRCLFNILTATIRASNPSKITRETADKCYSVNGNAHCCDEIS